MRTSLQWQVLVYSLVQKIQMEEKSLKSRNLDGYDIATLCAMSLCVIDVSPGRHLTSVYFSALSLCRTTEKGICFPLKVHSLFARKSD